MSLAVFLFPTNGFMLSFIPQTSVILGPLVLWLQGGPGWPSMYGMFKENGPFLLHVHKEGENVKMFGMFFYMPRRKVIVVVTLSILTKCAFTIASESGRVCSKLVPNPHSWHRDASLVYIDSPVSKLLILHYRHYQVSVDI